MLLIKANQVTADVGGDLKIESLQDTNQYKESSKSAGGSIMVGAGVSGSVNLAKSSINSNYQSVGEQSAIRAGDGGFQVKVKGNTTLTGAQITSTQAAIDNNKNSFQTGGTLTTTDLQNKASYEAKSVSVGDYAETKLKEAEKSKDQAARALSSVVVGGTVEAVGVGATDSPELFSVFTKNSQPR